MTGPSRPKQKGLIRHLYSQAYPTGDKASLLAYVNRGLWRRLTPVVQLDDLTFDEASGAIQRLQSELGAKARAQRLAAQRAGYPRGFRPAPSPAGAT